MYYQKIDLSSNKYKLCLSYCFEMFLLSSRSNLMAQLSPSQS